MARKTTQSAPEGIKPVLIEIPFKVGTTIKEGMPLSVSLNCAESEIFHAVGHALVQGGARLRDGTSILYDRSFRSKVVRYLLEQIEEAAKAE